MLLISRCSEVKFSAFIGAQRLDLLEIRVSFLEQGKKSKYIGLLRISYFSLQKGLALKMRAAVDGRLSYSDIGSNKVISQR